MTIMRKNIFICFMGFAVLSIFNVNHSFANDVPDRADLRMAKNMEARP